MKKIVFTVTTDLNNDQRMQRICTSLHNAGYEIILVGRLKKTSKPLLKQPFAQLRLHCFFDSSKWFYMEYNIRLFFYLLFKKTDIISSVDLDTVLPCYLVHRWKNCKIVYDAHEYFTELPELQERPKVKRIWNKIADYCLPNISNAYSVNQSLAEIFTDKYGIKYDYIRSITVQRDLEQMQPTDAKPIILYQGALNKGRGLEQSISAMQYIDNARLEIAGDGDLRQELKTQVHQLQLEDKVIFLGQLDPETLAYKTQEAYIGLNLLSGESKNYYYSLANKCFDYIHAEIPSVQMDFPEYRLINQSAEVSLLLPNLNIEEIQMAIKELLDNESLYQQLKENCKKAKELYTWENEEKKLISIYNNLS